MEYRNEVAFLTLPQQGSACHPCAPSPRRSGPAGLQGASSTATSPSGQAGLFLPEKLLLAGDFRGCCHFMNIHHVRGVWGDYEMGWISAGGIEGGAPCAAKGAAWGGGSQLLRYCGAAKSRTQRKEIMSVLSL